MHDLVVRGGLVVDGTGATPVQADVAVDAGRISAVGHLDEGGREELDAGGCVVTPGFVDPHTHLDAQLCWDPSASPSSLHGVTTVLMGMCGFGIAPCAPGGGDYLLRSLEKVEEIPYESSSLGVPFAWTTWPEFLDYLESRRPAVNVGGMVPHSSLRYFVMGDRAREEAATAEDREALTRELRRSLDGGALGFATSRGPNHLDAYDRPVQSRLADDDELRALVQECRGRPWQINLETKVSPVAAPMLAEVDRYAAWTEEAGARLTWSPCFAEPNERVWREVLEHHRHLNQRTTVMPQVSPTPFTTILRLDGARIPNVVGWRDALVGFTELDAAGRLERLAGPELRAAFRDAPRAFETMDAARRPRFGIAPRYDTWTIVHTTRTEHLGSTLTEAAERAGAHPADLLCDLAVADGLTTELQVPVVNGDQAAAAALSSDELTLIGLGDSGAHVATVTNYTYPTQLLARLVRDEQRFTLEDAVRRITSVPAQFFGVPDRGTLTPGSFADVCVVDLERLALGRLSVARDLPGGAPRLYRDAVGYAAVVVNGEVTVRDDALTGRTPGHAVRAAAAS